MPTVRKRSTGETAFLNAWRICTSTHLMALTEEFKFDAKRKWRFDFAVPEALVAIEIEGVTYGPTAGRHQQAAGFAADCEKYNCAAAAGWIVFRLTPSMIKSDPVRWIAMIIRAINDRTLP